MAEICEVSMYIRMADGRDKGRVFDMVEDMARAMLANGQALPIDFNEPDPLGAREMTTREVSPEVSTFVETLASPPLSRTSHSDHGKPAAGNFKKKSSR